MAGAVQKTPRVRKVKSDEIFQDDRILIRFPSGRFACPNQFDCKMSVQHLAAGECGSDFDSMDLIRDLMLHGY